MHKVVSVSGHLRDFRCIHVYFNSTNFVTRLSTITYLSFDVKIVVEFLV